MKIFNEEKITLKNIEKEINKLIKEEFNNNLNNTMLEKWNLLPVIFLEEENKVDKIIEVVKYIDTLEEDNKKKVSLILTAIYLIEELKLNILTKNVNNIYLLVCALDEYEIKEIKEKYTLVNNDELLLELRKKTLDNNDRVKIIINLLKVSDNQHQIIKMLKETSYYDLIESK